jgi:hypothetical protein
MPASGPAGRSRAHRFRRPTPAFATRPIRHGVPPPLLVSDALPQRAARVAGRTNHAKWPRLVERTARGIFQRADALCAYAAPQKSHHQTTGLP